MSQYNPLDKYVQTFLVYYKNNLSVRSRFQVEYWITQGTDVRIIAGPFADGLFSFMSKSLMYGIKLDNGK